MGLKDLPLAKGSKHVKVFESLGWELRRSEKNHFVLTSQDSGVFISIPDHKQVDRRTLKAEIRKAGLSDREYREAFDRI